MLGQTSVTVLIAFALLFSGSFACTPGGFVFYPSAAGCLATDNTGERLLMVQDTNSQWTFPAGSRTFSFFGFFDSGSTIAERETIEESGIDTTADRGAFCSTGGFLGFLSFAGYCCEPTDAAAVPSPDGVETIAAAYLSRATIAAFEASDLRFPEQQQLLLDVIDNGLC